MDLQPYTAAAFDGVDPDSREARELTAGLERIVHRRVVHAVEQAMADALHVLGAQGLAFEPDEAAGALAFRATVASGCTLSIVVDAGIGTKASLRDADTQAAMDAPPDWERRYLELAQRAAAAAGGSGPESLAAHERMAFALYRFEAEIANGGFEQFLLNSAGDHALLVKTSLKAIGARNALTLVTEAFKPFPKGLPPADRDARLRLMETMPAAQAEAWDQLTTRFYARAECIPMLVDEHLARTLPGWLEPA